VKVKCLYAFSATYYFCDFEKPGHLESRIEFCETPRHSPLKAIESGLSRENPDEWDSYVDEKIALYLENDNACITSVDKVHSIVMLK
jgi:hypothetical protein